MTINSQTLHESIVNVRMRSKLCSFRANERALKQASSKKACSADDCSNEQKKNCYQKN